MLDPELLRALDGVESVNLTVGDVEEVEVALSALADDDRWGELQEVARDVLSDALSAQQRRQAGARLLVFLADVARAV